MRTCGACIACCTYPKIKCLGKPGVTNCAHVRLRGSEVLRSVPQMSSVDDGKNCTIHGDQMPDVCREYECLWLQGHGSEEHRPDVCGILIDRSHDIGGAIQCKPLWSGADKAADGREAIAAIAASTGMVALVTTYLEARLSYVVRGT